MRRRALQCAVPIDHSRGEPATPRITCATCEACCCRLEVLLDDARGIPHQLTEVDRWGGLVMRRLADGWCAALDRNTLRCTIYAQRSRACRDYAMGGDDCLVERGG
jgi:Fe-S-cluster containining protein